MAELVDAIIWLRSYKTSKWPIKNHNNKGLAVFPKSGFAGSNPALLTKSLGWEVEQPFHSIHDDVLGGFLKRKN